MFHRIGFLAFVLSAFLACWFAREIRSEPNSNRRNLFGATNPSASPSPTPRPTPRPTPSDPGTGPISPQPGGPEDARNFSGTWRLDKSQSQGLSPRFAAADEVIWRITQDDKTIAIDQKVEAGEVAVGDRGGAGGGRGGPASGGTQPYLLNGKETVRDLGLGPNSGKRTTKATISGGTLELLAKTTFLNADGASVKNTTRQDLSLSADGKVLTATIHVESPRGSTNSVLIFKKQ